MEKEKTQKFINWLAKKLNVNSEAELEKAVKKMGTEGIQKAYAEFEASDTQQFETGGKLAYIECLKKFKTGGSIGKCGCGKKMKVKKAFLGAILSGVKALSGGIKAASALGKELGDIDTAKEFGTKAMKLGKVINTGNKLADGYNQLMKQNAQVFSNRQMLPSLQVGTVTNPNNVPGVSPAITKTTNPILSNRSIPTFMQKGGTIKTATKGGDKMSVKGNMIESVSNNKKDTTYVEKSAGNLKFTSNKGNRKEFTTAKKKFYNTKSTPKK